MKSKAGRKPIGDKALTDVQKTQAHRQRLKERKQLLDDNKPNIGSATDVLFCASLALFPIEAEPIH